MRERDYRVAILLGEDDALFRHENSSAEQYWDGGGTGGLLNDAHVLFFLPR